jgi:hypothetical protein
VKAYETLLKDF